MDRLCDKIKKDSVGEVIGEGIFSSARLYGYDITDDSGHVDDKEYEVLFDKNSEEIVDKSTIKTADVEDARSEEKTKVTKVLHHSLKQLNLGSEENWLKYSKIRNITIIDEEGNEKYIKIITIDLGWKKRWCGGYRNPRSKKIYWNAYAQTIIRGNGEIRPWPQQEITTVHRETQTHLEHVSRGVNTSYRKLTQTPIKFEEGYQTVIVPFKYLPRELLDQKKNRVRNAVLVIQKWVKRYIAMREYRIHRELEEKFHALEERRKNEIKKVEKVELPEALKLYMKPAVSIKAQLYSLEKEVTKWKDRELEKILTTKSGPTRYAELYQLLDKEIQFLYQYESVKTMLKMEQVEKRKEKFLQIIAASNNRKAKEVKELYELYMNTDESDERLKAIEEVQKRIDNHYIDYEWAEDLKVLLNREYNMIRAGYQEKDMNNLKMRIEELLFELLVTPEYNSLADKYVRKTTLTQNRLLTKQIQSTRKKTVEYETSCWLENIGKIKRNLTPYDLLLKYLRNSEKELTSNSWICLQVNAVDIYYLVDILWNGRSVLTEINDVDRLRILRWNIYNEWSPWNSIVLTEDEAILHAQVYDVNEIYDSTIIRKIQMKHILAKLRFNKLYKLSVEHFQHGGGLANNTHTVRSPYELIKYESNHESF